MGALGHRLTKGPLDRLSCGCKATRSSTAKDTILHVLDAVHHVHLVELAELLAQVDEAVVVLGQLDVLLARLRVQTEAQVERPVGEQAERLAPVVWVHALRAHEPLKLATNARTHVRLLAAHVVSLVNRYSIVRRYNGHR